MLQPFSCRLRLILVLIFIPNPIPTTSASKTQEGIVKKKYFNPGSGEHTIKFFTDRYPKTKVLYNFTEEVGESTAILNDFEDAGYYTLKVINVNGSFVDDIWIYHAIPSWLCKFKPSEYLLSPIPTEFVYNRTALIPCTILGAPPPIFSWEKYDVNLNKWVNVSTFDHATRMRYYQSELGHLYIKHFNEADIGNYRCRASNQCGGRCPNEKRCSLEDVIGDEVNLKASERDSDLVAQYFLNPVINNCWDSKGDYYNSNYKNCSGLSPNAGHIFTFSQYTPLNSSAILEAFFDFRRPQNDGMDNIRIGTVKWNEVRDLTNFYPIEDSTGKSGICIARIDGFMKANMEEYYYCSAYFPNGLLKRGVRFEFVMKEAPYVGIPMGVAGKDMARVIEVSYGSEQNLKFSVTITAPWDKNMVKDKWMCNFNGVILVNNWRQRCLYDPEEELVQFKIDYAVLGDHGYYQIIAGNDEGWAIGPPVLLVVRGTPPADGQYVLTVESRTTDTITVRWHRPTPVTDQNYSVEIKNTDFDEPVEILSVESVETAVLRNLKPGVRYAITVRLQGGLVADTKFIRTAAIKTAAQVDMSCSISATVIKCNWKDPDPSTIHGAELYYEATISTKSRVAPILSNTTRLESDKKKTENEIIFPNLLPHTLYHLRVVCCNEQGCSDLQKTREIRTEEEIPGDVKFRDEPRTSHLSVVVSMRYPPILPGTLRSEVSLFEETEIKKMRSEGKQPCGYTYGHYTNTSSTNNTAGVKPRQVFDKSDFVITGLKQSTTYYMRFQWTTKAGSGPLSNCFKLRIGRYINLTNMLIGCGVALFVIIMFTGFFFYVNRRYPGLFKVVLAKVRDHLQPSYMQPADPFDEFQNQEEDLNIVYEFDGPGEVYYLN